MKENERKTFFVFFFLERLKVEEKKSPKSNLSLILASGLGLLISLLIDKKCISLKLLKKNW